MSGELPNWLLVMDLRAEKSRPESGRAIFAERNFEHGFQFHKLFHRKELFAPPASQA
jgi:hypothetical protein